MEWLLLLLLWKQITIHSSAIPVLVLSSTFWYTSIGHSKECFYINCVSLIFSLYQFLFLFWNTDGLQSETVQMLSALGGKKKGRKAKAGKYFNLKWKYIMLCMLGVPYCYTIFKIWPSKFTSLKKKKKILVEYHLHESQVWFGFRAQGFMLSFIFFVFLNHKSIECQGNFFKFDFIQSICTQLFL